MKSSSRPHITYDIFRNLTEAEKRSYIDRLSTDYDVISGLQRDRRIYRKVVEVLTQQLEENGIIPATNFLKESLKH